MFRLAKKIATKNIRMQNVIVPTRSHLDHCRFSLQTFSLRSVSVSTKGANAKFS
jgi:hypothetical protein